MSWATSQSASLQSFNSDQMLCAAVLLSTSQTAAFPHLKIIYCFSTTFHAAKCFSMLSEENSPAGFCFISLSAGLSSHFIPGSILGLTVCTHPLPSQGSSSAWAWPGEWSPGSTGHTAASGPARLYFQKRGRKQTASRSLLKSSSVRNAFLPTPPPPRISSRWAPLLDLKMQI